MDEVDAADGVLISTQGLLMYLQPEEVRSLIAACAERFPGGALVFDSVPHFLAERSRSDAPDAGAAYRAAGLALEPRPRRAPEDPGVLPADRGRP